MQDLLFAPFAGYTCVTSARVAMDQSGNNFVFADGNATLLPFVNRVNSTPATFPFLFGKSLAFGSSMSGFVYYFIVFSFYHPFFPPSDGTLLAVGAYNYSGGTVFFFSSNSSFGTIQDSLNVAGNTGYEFGNQLMLSADGNVLACGAIGFNNYSEGIVYVFDRSVSVPVTGSIPTVTGVISGSSLTIAPDATLTIAPNSSLVLSDGLIIQQNASLVYGGSTVGSFSVITASSISGQFATVSTVNTSICFQNVQYTGISVVLTIDTSCGGLSTGAIVGIAVGSAVGAALIILLIVFLVHRATGVRTHQMNKAITMEQTNQH